MIAKAKRKTNKYETIKVDLGQDVPRWERLAKALGYSVSELIECVLVNHIIQEELAKPPQVTSAKTKLKKAKK